MGGQAGAGDPAVGLAASSQPSSEPVTRIAQGEAAPRKEPGLGERAGCSQDEG